MSSQPSLALQDLILGCLGLSNSLRGLSSLSTSSQPSSALQDLILGFLGLKISFRGYPAS